MLSAEELDAYIRFARGYENSVDESDDNESTVSSLGFGGDSMSTTTSYTHDPHAVSQAEAQAYYAGLPSEPTLLYRTGKEQWSPPRGPEAQRRLKELCEVFTHPIARVWSQGLGWKVVKVMDAHTIRFTTIDVVRFKKVEVDEGPEDEEDTEGEEESDDEEEGDSEEEGEAKKPVISPVTIWIGVFPNTTSATAAHNAAQDVLTLLKDYQVTDVDIAFRESLYMREVGPQLLRPVHRLDPLVDVISPLTPALGLGISTKARPNAQGTMALYLAEGGSSDRLLGLSCRHVLIGSQEANIDYVHHRSMHSKHVLLLGKRAFSGLVDLIKLRIGIHALTVEDWGEQIEDLRERERGTNGVDVAAAMAVRIEAQGLVDKAERAIEALGVLLSQINRHWKKLNNRVLGHILYSPAITLGVGEHSFTEDWGIFKVDRAKLGDGFQGNKIDLGTKLMSGEFSVKCYPRGDANWKFKYPNDRLLPLTGTISDELMCNPDMWDKVGEPCLLVVKSGNATGTTIGRANGIFSIVRNYFKDMSINQTSMEWGILNYDSKSEVFSEPGDSGSIIADIQGRIGGMLTGGSGNTKSSDITYATPFWWLLERIRAKGFPNAHLNIVA